MAFFISWGFGQGVCFLWAKLLRSVFGKYRLSSNEPKMNVLRLVDGSGVGGEWCVIGLDKVNLVGAEWCLGINFSPIFLPLATLGVQCLYAREIPPPCRRSRKARN